MQDPPGKPPIPTDVASALRTYLIGAGLSQDSADGLLEALSQDLAEGVEGAERIYGDLVRAGTEAAAQRVASLVTQIADLASVPILQVAD